MPFTTRIKVRFGDADPAGLVYFVNVFHYFHIAMEEFFAARCGVTYEKLMTDERIGFPTVNVQAEFLTPLVYGDDAEVDVYVSRVGTTSATFEYIVRRASDAAICARATNVQVAMNLDARRAVPIPDKYRHAFAASQY